MWDQIRVYSATDECASPVSVAEPPSHLPTGRRPWAFVKFDHQLSTGWQGQEQSGWPCEAGGRRLVLDPLGRNAVDPQWPRFTCRVPPGTGPFPVRRTFDKTTPDRIFVNVVDHFQKRRRIVDISIVPSTLLPEMASHPIFFGDRKPGQPLRRMNREPSDRGSCARLFDRRSDLRDIVKGLPGMHDQVHMLGHEHVSPQIEIPAHPCFVDTLDKPLTGPIFCEKRIPMITRPGQFMSVTRLVVVSAMTTRGFGHWTRLLRSQGHPLRC